MQGQELNLLPFALRPLPGLPMTRVIAPDITDDDIFVENTLRPRTLSDYVGQEKAKGNLRVFIDAARGRKEALDHVLLYGPPGLGKTTLSNIIAAEMGVNVKSTSGPVIERPGDLAAILTNLEPHDVLFIDEIHRLSHVVEEILYPAMEDFQLDIIIGQGPSARTVKLDLPRFTLVGATTRAGLLSSPLRDRFGVIARLEFYTEAELAIIVSRSARILGIHIEPETIIDKFGGGPVGLDTLAAAICEESDTIEDVYEPFLIQQGFLNRTPRGRMATQAAYLHLGRPFPDAPQGRLF